MENRKNNKIEEILKENLRSSVHIDSAFQAKLRSEVIAKSQSNIIKSFQMETNPNSGSPMPKRTNLFAKILLPLLAIVAVVTVGVLLITNQNQKPSDQIADQGTNTNPVSFARLYVLEGSVNVISKDTQTTVTSDKDLVGGDRLVVAENTIADVKTTYGRIALDAGSEIILNSLNGDVYPEVIDGVVFSSTNKDYEKAVAIKTVGADVVLEKGSALITQNGAVSTSDVSSIFDGIIGKAYAVADQSTKIFSISGTVKIKLGTTETVVENGKEVVIKDKKLSTPEVAPRELLNTEFFSEVVKKESNEGKDLGTASDITPPVVTIISPAQGTTVTTDTVEIKFKSNENGWFLNENPWRDITAEQENTFSANLKAGDNKIEIQVKDKYYNRTIVYLNINYDAPFAISWNSSTAAKSNGIYLNWSATGAQAGVHSYRLYRDGSVYKTYSVKSDTEIGANMTDSNTTYGETYSYEVKLMDGDTILARSGSKSLKAINNKPQDPPASTACKLSLWKTAQASAPRVPAKNTSLIFGTHAVVSEHYVKVGWSVSGDCPDNNGFKLVWSKDPNPVYPGDTYAYYSNTATRSGTASGLSSGTWYIRVSLYIGGVGQYYSNQLTVTIP